MNGEIPSIPITTLSGLASLTDLLSELPLPTPLPSTTSNKSLLYNAHISEEAHRVLNSQPDEKLVQQLLHALNQTNTDYIELKDNSLPDIGMDNDLPALMQTLLAQKPNLFKRRSPLSNNATGVSPLAPSPYYQPSPDGIVPNNSSTFQRALGTGNQMSTPGSLSSEGQSPFAAHNSPQSVSMFQQASPLHSQASPSRYIHPSSPRQYPQPFSGYTQQAQIQAVNQTKPPDTTGYPGSVIVPYNGYSNSNSHMSPAPSPSHLAGVSSPSAGVMSPPPRSRLMSAASNNQAHSPMSMANLLAVNNSTNQQQQQQQRSPIPSPYSYPISPYPTVSQQQQQNQIGPAPNQVTSPYQQSPSPWQQNHVASAQQMLVAQQQQQMLQQQQQQQQQVQQMVNTELIGQSQQLSPATGAHSMHTSRSPSQSTTPIPRQGQPVIPKALQQKMIHQQMSELPGLQGIGDVLSSDTLPADIAEQASELMEAGQGPLTKHDLAVLERMTSGQMQMALEQASGQMSIPQAPGQMSIPHAPGQMSIPHVSGQMSIPHAAGQMSIAQASGQMSIPHATGQMSIAQASGQMSLAQASGQMSIPQASGQMSIPQASGQMSIAQASGQMSIPQASGHMTGQMTPAQMLTGHMTLDHAATDLQEMENASKMADAGGFSLNESSGMDIDEHSVTSLNAITQPWQTQNQLPDSMLESSLNNHHHHQEQLGEDAVHNSFPVMSGSEGIHLDTTTGTVVEVPPTTVPPESSTTDTTTSPQTAQPPSSSVTEITNPPSNGRDSKVAVVPPHSPHPTTSPVPTLVKTEPQTVLEPCSIAAPPSRPHRPAGDTEQTGKIPTPKKSDHGLIASTGSKVGTSSKIKAVVVLEPLSSEKIQSATKMSKSHSSSSSEQTSISIEKGSGDKESKLSSKSRKKLQFGAGGDSKRVKHESKHESKHHSEHNDQQHSRPSKKSSTEGAGGDSVVPSPVSETSEPSSGVSLSRKRKRPISGRYDETTAGSDAEGKGKTAEMPKKVAKTERKRDRVVIEKPLTVEEMKATSAYKRFRNAVKTIFETAEECGQNGHEEEEEDDDCDSSYECPIEYAIPKALLMELNTESAKIKAMGIMNTFSGEKMVRLLTILEKNIRDGAKLHINTHSDETASENKLYRELLLERILKSLDACLVVLNIVTSPSMPKMVYLEDVIERVVQFAKFHLSNTIYPEFDPVYKIEPEAKGNIKLKRARCTGSKQRTILAVYNKMCDLVNDLSELLDIQILTDTIILQASSLGTGMFFVENINELQLISLNLVTIVFAKYEKHRQLIVEDIFASLARLPSTKRNIRTYRLNEEANIQMITALVMSLIQCVVALPVYDETSVHIDADDNDDDDDDNKPLRSIKDKNQLNMADNDVIIITSYETAMRTAQNFLGAFLKKCSTKEEEDYRPLFENFVQDLLSAANKPEWPASELLLSLLGRLLVHHFSNRSIDMSLRVASLDYLGVVAARLRKDAISSQLDDDTVENILNELNASEEGNSDTQSNASERSNTDRTEQLQRAILHYLQTNRSNDPALKYSGKFYIAQWYRDLSLETERINKDPKDADSFDDDGNLIDETTIKFTTAEKRKASILSLINYNQRKHCTSTILRHGVHSTLSYENASLVARYLASTRPFSRSFDIYLQQILRVLSEQAVAVRTKAMKCLTAVVEVDPGILARADMQQGVHGRFRDQSTSVREAAVELVGKFVLVKPELTHQYYDMLSERILDTGISVRKRVVKILRDICLEQPEFPKVVEICVKIIRRVNDEEGIKKLVNEVFQQLWFTPVLKGKNSEVLLRKVLNIADVVAACKDNGSEWFEQLLNNLLKSESDTLQKSVNLACEEVVDCLVDNVLSLERNIAEKSFDDDDEHQPVNSEPSPLKTSSQRLLSCITTLFLFSRVKPQFLVPHANTLSPYLTTKCNTQCDYLVLHYVAKILELVVPLMEHPGEAFLASLEEELLKLIFKQGMMVLQSCVSCLASVVNSVTHNFKLVRDCFQRFFSLLNRLKNEHINNPSAHNLVNSRPSLLRSLFTVGLFSKHFDFDAERKFANNTSKGCVRDRVFEVLFYFTTYPDEEIRLRAITSLGFQCITHADLMLGDKMKALYQSILANTYIPNGSTEDSECTESIATCRDKALKTLLRNIQTYLIEEEFKMRKADAEWSKHSKEEDLKEMGDVSSGMASSVIQVYLKHLLEVAFHHDSGVRMLTLTVFCLVLRQGLIHPVQCVPYLVAGGTDIDPAVRVKADQQLSEIDTKYPGFIHMKASQGIRMSYRLQQVLFKGSTEPVRGYRTEDSVNALCYHLYTTIRTNRQHRRALVLPLLKMFDDQSQKADLDTLVFVADNIAHFPYLTQDEPLFIIHHCDIVISISGANMIANFKELIFPERKVVESETGEVTGPVQKMGDITEELDDDLIDHFPEDSAGLLEWLTSSYCCVLLLLLKQHLKDLHGFSDAKCHRYAPCDSAKSTDKPVTRKNGVVFNPTKVLDYIKKCNIQQVMTEEWKQDVITHFYEFKEMMLKYDPTEEDDEEEEPTGAKPRSKTPSKKSISSDNTPAKVKVQQNDTSVPPIDDDHETETVDDGSAVKKSFMQRMKSKSHKSSKSRHSSKSAKKKHKKKKRKYFAESDSEDEDSDSDSDPDFMC